MSRWSWHEKPGTRNGPVIRKSDRLKPTEEERKDHERHQREFEAALAAEMHYEEPL